MTTPVAPDATPPATPPVPAAPAQVEDKTDKTDWKAEARKHEARAKENASAAGELAKLKQSQMSETDRLNAQLTESQQAASKATNEALRWRIAAKHGISDDDAETFLVGTDEASLTKQAERLKALATNAPPRSDPSQGARPGVPSGGPASDFADFMNNSMRQ